MGPTQKAGRLQGNTQPNGTAELRRLSKAGTLFSQRLNVWGQVSGKQGPCGDSDWEPTLDHMMLSRLSSGQVVSLPSPVTSFLVLRPKGVRRGEEKKPQWPRVHNWSLRRMVASPHLSHSFNLEPRFANNVKYQLKIAMRAFHLSFIALTDSIRLQKRTFFFSVLAYSDDL